jgi:hypothetical protein
MHKAGLSKAQTRILEQYWKLGTCSVREIPDSLPEDERVAYTTVQTLVYRLEQKGALRGVGRGVQHCNGWAFLEPCRIPLVVSLMSMSPRSPYFHVLSRADAKSPTMAS